MRMWMDEVAWPLISHRCDPAPLAARCASSDGDSRRPFPLPLRSTMFQVTKPRLMEILRFSRFRRFLPRNQTLKPLECFECSSLL
jgi:hypothetical protein